MAILEIEHPDQSPEIKHDILEVPTNQLKNRLKQSCKPSGVLKCPSKDGFTSSFSIINIINEFTVVSLTLQFMI